MGWLLWNFIIEESYHIVKHFFELEMETYLKILVRFFLIQYAFKKGIEGNVQFLSKPIN